MGAGNCPSSSSGFDSDSHASPQHSKMLSLEYGGRPTMLSLRVRVITKISITKSPHTSRVFDHMVSVWPVFHSWANLYKSSISKIPYAENTINPHSTFPCRAPWNGFYCYKLQEPHMVSCKTSPTLGDVTIVTSPVTIDLGTKNPHQILQKTIKEKAKKIEKPHLIHDISLPPIPSIHTHILSYMQE